MVGSSEDFVIDSADLDGNGGGYFDELETGRPVSGFRRPIKM